jgi:hypothetical protein
VKEIKALPEDPTLVIVLNPETLPGVQSSQTLFQFFENVATEREISAVLRFFAELKIHLFPRTHSTCVAQAMPAGLFLGGIG